MKKAKSKGEQPDALVKLAQVARNNGGIAVGDESTGHHESMPISTDPELQHDAATKLIREGITHRDEGAKEAVHKLPDRTAEK
jgi:hypothetical protein